MAIVRLEALNALAALLQLEVPGLQCICEGVAPPSEQECYPNASLQPTRWTYEPEQREEHKTLPGNVAVFNVGQHSAPMVISIVTSTLQDRHEIEAKILNLFLGAEHPLTGMAMPGVLCLPVTACPELGDWLASFELESDEWNNADAFDRRYESKIIVTAIIPALTVKRNVYSVNELRLGLTPDMSKQFAPSPFVTASDVEVVRINEDGTISPVTPEP